MIRRAALMLIVMLALAAPPALARDSLGVFGEWGAFRDPGVPRCYAIAMAVDMPGRQRDFQPFATVGFWPRQALRGEVHFRVSRRLAPKTRVALLLGGQTFELAAGEGDAWAQDRRMDAAVVAAMRSASQMTVTARAGDGRVFRDTYHLAGAATAIDAATISCAKG